MDRSRDHREPSPKTGPADIDHEKGDVDRRAGDPASRRFVHRLHDGLHGDPSAEHPFTRIIKSRPVGLFDREVRGESDDREVQSGLKAPAMKKKKTKANRRRLQRTRQLERVHTSSSAISKSSLTCRECQAPNDPDASECWLCHRRDWRSNSAPSATTTKSTAKATFLNMWMPVGETLLILMLAVAVVGNRLLLGTRSWPLAFLVLLVPSWAIAEVGGAAQPEGADAGSSQGREDRVDDGPHPPLTDLVLVRPLVRDLLSHDALKGG